MGLFAADTPRNLLVSRSPVRTVNQRSLPTRRNLGNLVCVELSTQSDSFCVQDSILHMTLNRLKTRLRTLCVLTLLALALTASASSLNHSYGPPVLTSLTVSPYVVFGGNSSTGTVTLSGPAPAAGIIVALSSDLTTVTVPTSVTLASGQTSVKFTINTTPISQVTFGSITAKLNGVTKTAIITVSAPVLTGLTLSQSTVQGSKSAVATLTLSSPAPAGGLAISMSASTTVAAFLNSVIVPAGKTSVTFTIITIPLTTKTSDTITATFGTASVSAPLTITP